jgi:hypothetical protein
MGLSALRKQDAAPPTQSIEDGFSQVSHGEVYEPWQVSVDQHGHLCFGSHTGDGTYHTCLSIAPRSTEDERARAAQHQLAQNQTTVWQWWCSLVAPWWTLFDLYRNKLD